MNQLVPHAPAGLNMKMMLMTREKNISPEAAQNDYATLIKNIKTKPVRAVSLFPPIFAFLPSFPPFLPCLIASSPAPSHSALEPPLASFLLFRHLSALLQTSRFFVPVCGLSLLRLPRFFISSKPSRLFPAFLSLPSAPLISLPSRHTLSQKLSRLFACTHGCVPFQSSSALLSSHSYILPSPFIFPCSNL